MRCADDTEAAVANARNSVADADVREVVASTHARSAIGDAEARKAAAAANACCAVAESCHAGASCMSLMLEAAAVAFAHSAATDTEG